MLPSLSAPRDPHRQGRHPLRLNQRERTIKHGIVLTSALASGWKPVPGPVKSGRLFSDHRIEFSLDFKALYPIAVVCKFQRAQESAVSSLKTWIPGFRGAVASSRECSLIRKASPLCSQQSQKQETCLSPSHVCLKSTVPG